MIDFTDYGFDPILMQEGTDNIPARVTAVYKDRYELICPLGQIFGKLKSRIYRPGPSREAIFNQGEAMEEFPTTGDFVLVQYIDTGDSLIIKTLPRKSLFSRLDPSSAGHYSQAVAANFDYVFIMVSLNHDFSLRRIERYLTLSWQSGAIPVIIMTKSDLVDGWVEQQKALEKIAVGVGILAVSAMTGFGIDQLGDYLKPRKTIVLLGSSGVGKSSLVNAMAGQELMLVNSIREGDSKGRHTTTHRLLIMLKSGVMIIDTPGMRELGMWDVTQGLGETFSDVEDYFGKCRFSDCKHGNEPGCEIKSAIKSGKLSQKRWDSYMKLRHEARYSEDKVQYNKESKQWGKTITINSRQTKKYGGKRY